MNMEPRQSTFLFIFFLFSFTKYASAHDISGYLSAEGRYFFHESVFEEQRSYNLSLATSLDYYHDFENNNQRVVFSGYSRIDDDNSERDHSDIRELYWWRNFDTFEMYAGIRKVFWGVTESVHLVNILNQTDVLENFDGEDKLGQAMLELVTAREWGTLSMYILPHFRERQYPDVHFRLRPNLPIANEAIYQSDKKEKHIDLALRYAHYTGIWDIGISHFSGTDRKPNFGLRFDNQSNLIALIPTYVQIEQSGVDIQATVENCLIKLEVISRYEKNWGRNTAAAGGVEYTFFSVSDSSADLGILAEYQFDDRRGGRSSIAQNDFAIGARWAFNDIDGSELLLLASQDLDQGNRFYSLELGRRFNEKWKIEAEARFFSSIEDGSTESYFRDDDYIQVEIRRYF